MREVLPELLRWMEAGEPVALARVVRTADSAPRLPGASMLLGPDGQVVGSLSGGCVEGAVLDLAAGVLACGVPALARYGVADEDAWAVGLTCGGTLEVYVERLDPASHRVVARLADDVARGRPAALATVVAHPVHDGQGKGDRGTTTSNVCTRIRLKVFWAFVDLK